MRDIAPVFQDVPRGARQHFVLHIYTAVYRLVNHIRRLGEAGGEDLDATFKRYPFLAGYFAEILQYMPDEITWDQGLALWVHEITAWERAAGQHLPLLALTEQSNLDFRSRVALMLVGLVEEDSRFGTLFAELQQPLPQRRPCLELVGQMMIDDEMIGTVDPWHVCQPLIGANLVDVVNKETPRSEWVLRVPPMLWDVMRGETEPQPASWCQYQPAEAFPPMQKLILPEAFLTRLAQVPSLVREGKARAIVLRGSLGSERLQVMGAVAQALGYGVAAVDGAARWEYLGAFCAMTRSLPVITYDLGPGETETVPTLAGYQGPIGILIGLEGGLQGPAVEKAVTLSLPMPRVSQRTRHWQKALAGHPVEDLAEISERFHIPGGYIRQAGAMAVAHAALDGDDRVRLDHVREACRALNRQLLDTLATRLEVEGSWDRLVVSEVTMSKLLDLERRCRHREGLLDHLGPAFDAGMNRGVRALFTGASGTGKTLAAKLLAAELGMDLYRVDLAAVVNKYIGETEKNLHRVLSRAEELDVILLLDEGDALLGNRTEVKSANDRYANLETNYLLQKLEHYQGIVLVTTNARHNIDSAFQRRMDVVVNFISPQAQERWHIWRLHLPQDHAVDEAYLEEVSVRCAMTGGEIRNAALHATLLALDDGRIVRRWHLEQAVQSEYRKAGAICPLNGNGGGKTRRQSMETFLDALAT